MTDMKRHDNPSPRTTPHPASPTQGRGDKKKDLRSVKLGRLFAEAKKRGIDGEQLRNEIAPAQLGKRLSKASVIEIEKLIQFLGAAPSFRTTPHPSSPTEGRGDKARGEATPERPLMSGFKERYEELGRREGMATPAQLRMIEAMWMDVSRMPNHTAKERALQGFLKRITGVDDLRFLESWMVQKVVRAITAMQR